ncbi:MAG: hypothetical protein RRC07_11495 [Anaerolineae bacterium]|nr:hypothetical protein [Anaerolineae bacterium]
MPALTRVAVRAALIYLVLGFTFGGLLLSNKGVPFAAALWRLRPAHIEFLFVGWMVQFALGIAHWIIPRFRGGDFGRTELAWLALGLLNAGILLLAFGPLLGLGGWAQAVGRALEAGAAVSYGVYIWPRVRPR